MRSKIISFLFSAVALVPFASAFADTHLSDKQPSAVVRPGRGEPLLERQYPSAINAAAGIAVNPNSGYWPYQTFYRLHFNFWQVGQEGMELAINGQGLGSTVSTSVPNNSTLLQPASYQPGFTVGLGMCVQDWEILSSYTWVRSTISQTEAAPSSSYAASSLWLPQPWIQNPNVGTASLQSAWRVAMDVWDTTASRPFYQGPSLTIQPFGGIRAAWIRQKLDLTLTAYPLTGLTPTQQPIQSRNLSKAWALGPRMGSEIRCLLPMGFRLEGDLAASLLFTRYTTVFHKENPAETLSIGRYQTYADYDTLRPGVEAGVGLGWGMYLANKSYHLDFTASYDFQLFWDQNMMRRLVSEQYNQSYATGNLLLQGLTLAGRFDF